LEAGLDNVAGPISKKKIKNYIKLLKNPNEYEIQNDGYLKWGREVMELNTSLVNAKDVFVGKDYD
jgi:hypothetical protein